MDVTYVCVAAEAGGVSIPLEQLGDYAVRFQEDGVAQFRVVGSELPGLTWTRDGADFVIDYYGTAQLRFVPAAEGLRLDYFGAMDLTFAPEGAAAEPLPAEAIRYTVGKFVCTAAATPDGTALNLANLGGEYAILLGSDGLATFTINGYPLSGLPWREEEGVYIVDYNGAYDLRFVPIPGGLELDYFGTMVLTFSPAP